MRGSIANASPAFASALLVVGAAAASEASMLRLDAAGTTRALVSKTTGSGHFRSEWMRIVG